MAIQQYEEIDDLNVDINPVTPTGGDPVLKQYLIDEFVEDYQNGQLSRRDALKRIAFITGSALVASNILTTAASAQQPTPTGAAGPTGAATRAPTAAGTPAATAGPTATPTGMTIRPDDPDITAMPVQFPGEGATILAYLGRPKGNGPFPAVLICHENRGLVEHIRDVARRFAKVGYVGLAVDLLSRNCGTQDPAQVPGLLGNTSPDQQVKDFQAGLAYLQAQSFVMKDRIGMTGFCFGGGITWRAATKIPELRAAVPFYGPNPPLEDVPNIRAAILAFYGANDARITGGEPAIEDAMKKSNKVFEKMIYPNAGHAFFNDTGPAYNADAAKDAWPRMLAWFDKYLKS